MSDTMQGFLIGLAMPVVIGALYVIARVLL